MPRRLFASTTLGKRGDALWLETEIAVALGQTEGREAALGRATEDETAPEPADAAGRRAWPLEEECMLTEARTLGSELPKEAGCVLRVTLVLCEAVEVSVSRLRRPTATPPVTATRSSREEEEFVSLRVGRAAGGAPGLGDEVIGAAADGLGRLVTGASLPLAVAAAFEDGESVVSVVLKRLIKESFCCIAALKCRICSIFSDFSRAFSL